MKTNVTDAQLLAFFKRSAELHRRITEGTLPVEHVLAGMQELIEGKFSATVAQFMAGDEAKPMTLAEMIAAAGFKPNRASSNLTEENFPLNKEGSYDASGLGLYGGDREWAIAEIEAAIKPTGGRLEGLVRGLAYLKANPDALKDGPIVFPASTWVSPDGSVDVPYAGLGDGEPWLLLSWDGRDGRWDRHCRFLVSGKCA